MPSKNQPPFRVRAAASRGLPCRFPGCTEPRPTIGPWCSVHRKRVERTGHPAGRTIRSAEFAVERQLVESFLKRNADHEGLKAALKWIEKWMEEAAGGVDVPGRVFMERLQRHGVPAQSVLTTAVSLFLFSKWKPRALPDDVRLDFQIGYNVCCLAPREKRRSTRQGAPCVVSEVIGKVPRREIGRRLRHVLAPLLANVAEAISTEQQEQNSFTVAIRRPFESVQSSSAVRDGDAGPMPSRETRLTKAKHE